MSKTQSANVVQYQSVRSLSPQRSMFNLSHTKLFSADMGKLYPSAVIECVPGDVFKLSNELVVRLQPLVAPVLHEIYAYVHYFFVP